MPFWGSSGRQVAGGFWSSSPLHGLERALMHGAPLVLGNAGTLSDSGCAAGSCRILANVHLVDSMPISPLALSALSLLYADIFVQMWEQHLLLGQLVSDR